MRNALSIDVEEYFQVEAFAQVISRPLWELLEPRLPQVLPPLLDLLEARGVRATFFCLGWVAKRYPALIKEIAARGHELASHGWSHVPIFRLSPEEFRKEVRDSKALLEDLAGRRIEGFRASTYSITPKTLWALPVLAEEGYRYDSSIFPIRHDLYGFPRAPRFPFLLKDLALKEFPISTVKLGPLNVPVAGGGYFRLFPYPVTRRLLRLFNRKEKKPFVFYVHPWEFDPLQPRLNGPLKSRLRHYLNLSRTEERFKKLLADFSFGPLNEIIKGLEPLPEITLEDLRNAA